MDSSSRGCNNNNNNSKVKKGHHVYVCREGDEWSFQDQQTISMDWTHEEQAILEEGLCKYASETSIIRYAKIAVQIENKSVRDVALRCRWMTKKDISKRKKEDFNARKIKGPKEKVVAKPTSCSGIQWGVFSYAPVMASNFNYDMVSYNDVGRSTCQLLQQNAWIFKQISANLATHQIHENICLLSQGRDNIFKILSNLNDVGPTIKMPPLPRVNEELANTILPLSPFQIH